jgi:hypothetical protein
MKRRDILAAGLGGAALSWLGRACTTETGTKPPERTNTDIPQPVYELTDGRSLYDDFDGDGNLQTFDGQPLAVAGQLSSRIWSEDFGGEILDDPFARPLFSIVDENGERIGPGPHDQSWRRLLVRGAADAVLETPAGPFAVEKGRTYGVSEVALSSPRGYVLKLTNLFEFDVKSFVKVRLANPEVMDFPDFKSFSADVLLSSESPGQAHGAGLDFHTTIPEQPPGKSWWTQSLIVRGASGEVFLLGLYGNYNTGEERNLYLGRAEYDRWYSLRLNIVTRLDDAGLGSDEIRLDFHVNGEFKGSLFPEDGPILLDSQRTGVGPHRALAVYNADGLYNAVSYFDNVRAVYRNRVG